MNKNTVPTRDYKTRDWKPKSTCISPTPPEAEEANRVEAVYLDFVLKISLSTSMR